MAPRLRPRPSVPPFTAIVVSVTAAALLSLGSIALVAAQRPGAPRTGIAVYEDINYGGRSQCWDADEEEQNLQRRGWNDRISSIRIFGRARVEVYRDADYRGQRLRLDRDAPDLGAINWSDQISSFQVR